LPRNCQGKLPTWLPQQFHYGLVSDYGFFCGNFIPDIRIGIQNPIRPRVLKKQDNRLVSWLGQKAGLLHFEGSGFSAFDLRTEICGIWNGMFSIGGLYSVSCKKKFLFNGSFLRSLGETSGRILCPFSLGAFH